jgi:AraC-like DNA-binding protein
VVHLPGEPVPSRHEIASTPDRHRTFANAGPGSWFPHDVHVALKPMESVLFRSELVLFADFRCRPDDPLFHDSGPANAHSIAFPSTATKILLAGRAPVHENPTAISLLNRGEEYRRDAISEEGADGTWYTLDDDVLAELFYTATGSRRSVRFRSPQVRVPASTILRERRLVANLRQMRSLDTLAIEEEILDLTRSILGHDPSRASERVNGPLVERATEYLLANFTMPASLAAVARELGASASYLSRAFHAGTGMTMSAFRQRLRLITALDRLPHSAGDVTRLALDLGYSSHSHFTSAFRALFGQSPSAYLREISG